MGVKQISGTPQSARSEPVISRHQSAVVTVGPVKQALVVGRDMPLFLAVDDRLYPGVAGRDLSCHLGAAIRRRVIDDEHAHIDALLVIKHAGDHLFKEVPVLVAGNHDAN